MALVFPTITSVTLITILAAYHSTQYLSWITAAATLLLGFALFCAKRSGSRGGRARIAVGSLIGFGSLIISFLTHEDPIWAESRNMIEWTMVGMLIALFLVRGWRGTVLDSDESMSEPA